MKVKNIDQQKCIKCTECLRDCPSGLFTLEKANSNNGIFFDDPLNNCIGCGHCVAVCPVGAVNYIADSKAYTFDHITDPAKWFSPDLLEKFLARRRSVRRFKDGAITPSDLAAFFRAMQHAPSATNARSWEFVAVTSKPTIKYMSGEAVKFFKFFRSLIRLRWIISPFLNRNLRKLLHSPKIAKNLDKSIADYEGGKDIILFDAPCVVILHAPPYGHLAGNDAGIILTHGMLAAESLGLGSCWIGFLQETFRMNKKLKIRLNIPPHHKVEGVLVLGYPAVQYKNVPPREPLRVSYV